jgi:hypothetical protein
LRHVLPPPETESPFERRLGLALLACALAVGFALRGGLALRDDGLYWPDEIYQSLEPAHRLVHGYGLVAWEFVEGARNWAFPGLVAFALKVCDLLGLREPRGYIPAMKLLFAALGTATGWGVFRLARVSGAGPLPAAVAGSAWALCAPALYFGPRALSETASALPVVFGLAFALAPGADRKRRLFGASLLGLSALLRLQNGLFCVALLGILLARGRRREALEALGVLALWALLYGLLDAVTWGGWFHSAIVYLRFNVLEGRGAAWGVAGPGYYPRVLESALTPPLAWSLLLLWLLGARRAPGLFLAALAYGLAHTLIAHKELRFLLPALPLGFAVAALGVDALPRPGPRWAALGLLGFGAVASAGAFPQLTFGQLGAYEDSRPQASAFDDAGPINRLLLAAHDRADLCGLKIEATHLAWTGGVTYLHRPVPLYPHTGPPRQSGFYNYVIAWAPGGGEVVAREGNLVLAKLPVSTCANDPGYQWRLP